MALPDEAVGQRILVAGCTGTIGSHLLPVLRAQFPGARLFGVSRGAPNSQIAAALDAHFPLDLIREDEVNTVVAAVRPDVTIHLASPRMGSLIQMLHSHVDGMANLLKAVRDHAGPRSLSVVVGSAAEIGRCLHDELPLRESAVCRPLDDYGVAKQAQAVFAQAIGERYGQAVVRVRLFNLLGPGLPPTLLSGRCVRLLAQNALVPDSVPFTFGSLSAVRDYTDVRDVCEALALAVRRGRPGRLYHIGTGNALSGTAVVRGLMAAAGSHMLPLNLIECDDCPPVIPIQSADSTLARKDLGWQPRLEPCQSFTDMWRHALAETAGQQTGPALCG